MIRKLILLIVLITACNAVHASVSDSGVPEAAPTNSFVPPPKKPCPDDMVYIERSNMRFCIDVFEFPDRKGEYPIAAIDGHEAEALCVGVGKRICDHSEWITACRGKESLKYSYGNTYVKDRCNDSRTDYVGVKWGIMENRPAWRIYAHTLYKGERSGSRLLCKSDEGVFDMNGNVREWQKEPKSQYGYVFGSSYWYGDMARNFSCGFAVGNHVSTFATYESGVRCCKSAE